MGINHIIVMGTGGHCEGELGTDRRWHMATTEYGEQSIIRQRWSKPQSMDVERLEAEMGERVCEV